MAARSVGCAASIFTSIDARVTYKKKGAWRRPDSARRKDVETTYWIYGLHAARAACANTKRTKHRLVATRNAADKLGPVDLEIEIASRRTIDSLVPSTAVHQGIALSVDPLPSCEFEEAMNGAGDLIVVLDQVTDPQNVGAVLRCAAAFEAGAVVTTRRHSAPESGVLAKAASGALDIVPYIREANLVKTLDALQLSGFTLIGLDSEAPQDLSAIESAPRTALVLGAEGKGLRQSTRETCDWLARLPTASNIGSLNVASASAVALYELARRR